MELNLMNTPYAKVLLAAAKETDEQKKAREINTKVTNDYRNYQDELVSATRSYEDAEREYKYASEDLTRDLIESKTYLKTIQTEGTFGVNFSKLKATMFNTASKIKNLEEELKPLAEHKVSAENYLALVKDQGKILFGIE